MPKEETDANVNVPTKRKKLLPYTIIGAIMLVEGLAVYIAAKTLGSDPAAAEAGQGSGESIGPDGMPTDMDVELLICELDAFNKKTGRLMMYHIQVVAIVNRGHEERLQKLVELRRGTISDRVTTVIRSAEPKYLSEPGLETIRRQIKFELDKIFGDETLIIELLIPKLLQSSSNL